jgi:hypothetical protein
MPTDRVPRKLFDYTQKEEGREADHWKDGGTSPTDPVIGKGQMAKSL